ncbi:class I SAM-dependent methyltransferase [Sinisalibacter aestuarii]|nr:class I SAM-dependent methyltransferase [Sinisalibacter aestuarii]
MADETKPPEDWRSANRATWDERVGLHLAAEAYDLAPLRAGQAALHPIEEAETGDVAGLKIAHLQCHFGRDSLILAQKGAEVVGLDFSPAAIAAARALAGELGLAARARFVEADLYAAPEALAAEGPFDMVFVTWGAIGWLPDLDGWARVVAALLREGGRLYLAEGHPFAMVFETDDLGADEAGRPRWYMPYLDFGLWKDEAPRDYTGDFPALKAGHEYWWDHQLGHILTALAGAGLRLDWLHEHDAVPWPMFSVLEPAPGGMFRWPGKRWLPLSFSLFATKMAR